MSIRRLQRSRTYPVSVEQAYDVVLHAPLTEIFGRRYGAIARIAAVEGQVGVWGSAVGHTRTIRLSDGGTMTETLTMIEGPRRFGYRISDITGTTKALVASVDGTWSFDPAGTGVRITWAWAVAPTAQVGRLAMPLFARLWAGYARQGLDEIERLLVP